MAISSKCSKQVDLGQASQFARGLGKGQGQGTCPPRGGPVRLPRIRPSLVRREGGHGAARRRRVQSEVTRSPPQYFTRLRLLLLSPRRDASTSQTSVVGGLLAKGTKGALPLCVCVPPKPAHVCPAPAHGGLFPWLASCVVGGHRGGQPLEQKAAANAIFGAIFRVGWFWIWVLWFVRSMWGASLLPFSFLFPRHPHGTANHHPYQYALHSSICTKLSPPPPLHHSFTPR